MTWKPTPDDVKRAMQAEVRAPVPTEEQWRIVTATLRAFVPEGTVPVFLTREELEAKVHGYDDAAGEAAFSSALAKLDAARKA